MNNSTIPPSPEQLFEQNRGLVGLVLKRFHTSGGIENMDDLRQVGLWALWDAAQRFDGRAKFSSYAVPYITGYILDHLHGRSALHVPRNARYDLKRNVLKLKDDIEHERITGYTAERKGKLLLEQEENLRRAENTFYYLGEKRFFYSTEDESTHIFFTDIVDDSAPTETEIVNSIDTHTTISHCLPNLDPRELIIILLRYCLWPSSTYEERVRVLLSTTPNTEEILESPRVMTLEEIGRVLGVTRERTRGLEARALDKMKTMLATSGNGPLDTLAH